HRVHEARHGLMVQHDTSLLRIDADHLAADWKDLQLARRLLRLGLIAAALASNHYNRKQQQACSRSHYQSQTQSPLTSMIDRIAARRQTGSTDEIHRFFAP